MEIKSSKNRIKSFRNLALLISLFFSFAASAQNWQKPNNAYGTISNGQSVTRILLFPTGCGAPALPYYLDSARMQFAIYGDSCANRLYLYNPKLGAWDTISGASGGGVTVVSYGKNATKDSTVLTLSDGTRLAAKDSVGSGGINDSTIIYASHPLQVKDSSWTVGPDTLHKYTIQFRSDSLVTQLAYTNAVDTAAMGSNPNNVPSIKWLLPRLGAGGGSGTVSNIATGYGLSGGPITTTGTIVVDSAALSLKYPRIKDSTVAYVTPYQSSLKANNSNTVTVNGSTQTLGSNPSFTVVTVTSFAKNAGKDSSILTLSNGTRYAVKDSTGGGNYDSAYVRVSTHDSTFTLIRKNGDSTISTFGSGVPYIDSVALNTENVLYNTSVTFPIASHKAVGALTFKNQSAYTGFGNWTSGSAKPTFGKIPILAISATGTADATTYLRGDGSWGTPAGGGGGGGLFTTINTNDAYYNGTGSIGIGYPVKPRSKLTILSNTAGNSEDSTGLYLGDSTLATSGNPKWSPPFIQAGKGFLSGNSANVRFKQYVITSGSNASGTLFIDYSTNDGAYTNALQLGGTGNLTVPGTFTAGNIAGTFLNGIGLTLIRTGNNMTSISSADNISAATSNVTYRGLWVHPVISGTVGETYIKAIETSIGDVALNTTSGNTIIGKDTADNANKLSVVSTNSFFGLPSMTSAQRDSVYTAFTGTVTGTTVSGNNTYYRILTGGTGTGATATIVVVGGVATSFKITNYGKRYVVGDALATLGITYTITALTAPRSGSSLYNTTLGYAQTYNGNYWSPVVDQTTLISGTKTVTITGLTTGARATVTMVTPSGTSLTTSYQAVCTANTLTIQANVAAGTINTADGSTLNYVVY